jgi:hypothetical protein
VGSEDDGGEILETEVRESVIRIASVPLSHECNILIDTSIQRKLTIYFFVNIHPSFLVPILRQRPCEP